MLRKYIYFFSLFLLLFLSCKEKIQEENNFVIYQVDPKKQDVKMYWKKSQNEILKSINNLKNEVESRNEQLIFAMNGGMFEADHTPKGLYIENFKILKPIDTLQGSGNFYLQPNGIFYITRNHQPKITETKKYRQSPDIQYATQSGPMLLMDGKINPLFQKDSKNLNIRNGVGILENGEIIFAMSKKEINFYTLAQLFQKMGCKSALYLDGYVSRAYLPEKNWFQTDGDFGVIIGITAHQ
ncbi:phosphodiester glycosidase family protein [Chryseobacterium indologenes]|uniref:phosphodiester glycosidase family protein n=1 Tax=Chryseobacterium indologenes TaxID=253 RepID=UPI0023E7A572|nr:phosphodiester glycosidase family protein [Chryseobacterium indologenes]WET47433.1 phosphodiester glycosidase family protein [Chryseobacterium indologenes]